MKENQKRMSLVLAGIAAMAVVAVAVFFWVQKRGLPTGTQQTTQNVQVIQDAGGLNSVASELDETDLNAVDQELNQLDSEASAF